MKISLMFFSSLTDSGQAEKYRLLFEVARRADESQFTAIWTPERHFHPFGGIFPNPSVTSAALAVATKRLQIRAGSLISPLHHSIRIAEDWSVVDNLSGGRVAVAFGSGWNVNDFIFFPERFAERKSIMFSQIEAITRLWKGETLSFINSQDRMIDVRLFPSPIQAELPIWVTSSGDSNTFVKAGEIGANVLTHLIGQDFNQLKLKIDKYKAARERVGLKRNEGTVTLMMHTYLSTNARQATAEAREPLRAYIKSSITLENEAAAGGGTVSGGRLAHDRKLSPSMEAELLEFTVDRYLNSASLIGDEDSALTLIKQLKDIGINEIACLIDFGISPESVLASLSLVDRLVQFNQ